MKDNTDISLDCKRLLLWLMDGELTFTKIGQRFNHHKIDQDTRNKMIDKLVSVGLATVESDRNNLSRFSKGGRPQRVLTITHEGMKFIGELEDEELDG